MFQDSDLTFEDPRIILGTGTFGKVTFRSITNFLLSFYQSIKVLYGVRIRSFVRSTGLKFQVTDIFNPFDFLFLIKRDTCCC